LNYSSYLIFDTEDIFRVRPKHAEQYPIEKYVFFACQYTQNFVPEGHSSDNINYSFKNRPFVCKKIYLVLLLYRLVRLDWLVIRRVNIPLQRVQRVRMWMVQLVSQYQQCQ
jgi:hypothetical protein